MVAVGFGLFTAAGVAEKVTVFRAQLVVNVGVEEVLISASNKGRSAREGDVGVAGLLV